MPAVAKTSVASILASARQLLDAGGADAVSMQAIARAESIRAPSLYKHFPDRAAVMAELALDGFRQLAAEMQSAAREADPFAAMAHRYRHFASSSANQYLHMMSSSASLLPDVDAARRQAAEPILALLQPAVGAGRALTTARLLTAFLHGFATMELAGAFRLGGDVDRDFREGVETLRRLVGVPLTTATG
jgi:AcrR family transcriptional regulator